VAAPEPTSVGRRDPELRNTWQRWSSLLGEVDPGVMGHVAAPDLSSQRDRARSHGTRGSAGAHLGRERDVRN
jgi:hypothetical protein